MAIRFIRLLTMIAAFWAVPAMAQQALPPSDAAAFRETITRQIEAFGKGDGGTAWSFASPGIQAKFGDAGTFLRMVAQGYGALVNPKSVEFGDVTSELGWPTQVVTVVDRDGHAWQALYAFERQSDGSWRISACTLRRLAGADA
ncbi:MAG: DUF4864 domain-containing protein [Hyphomicrobiales bacterium]